MLAYWGRIIAAWVLLKIASSVVNDAEKLMRSSLNRSQPAVAVEGGVDK